MRHLRTIIRYWVVLLLLPLLSFAVAPSLGEVSSDLTGAFGMVTDLAFKGCYIIGAGLLVATILRYMAHRKNKQQVRLGEVFSLLIFSLIMLALPLLVQQASGAKIMRKVKYQQAPTETTPEYVTDSKQQEAEQLMLIKQQQQQNPSFQAAVKDFKRQQTQHIIFKAEPNQFPFKVDGHLQPPQSQWQQQQLQWQQQQLKILQQQMHNQEKLQHELEQENRKASTP